MFRTKISKDLSDSWKAIEHGKHETMPQLLQAVRSKLFIDNWSEDLLSKPAMKKLHSPKQIIKLGLISVSELGFNAEATIGDINKRLCNNGAEKCFSETPLELGLIYDDQPKGKWVWFYMDPIIATGGSPFIFKLARRGGGNRWLIGECGLKHAKLHPDSRIVYRISDLS